MMSSSSKCKPEILELWTELSRQSDRLDRARSFQSEETLRSHFKIAQEKYLDSVGLKKD